MTAAHWFAVAFTSTLVAVATWVMIWAELRLRAFERERRGGRPTSWKAWP